MTLNIEIMLSFPLGVIPLGVLNQFEQDLPGLFESFTGVYDMVDRNGPVVGFNP